MTTLPAITEKQFQAQVIQLAKLYGWKCFHVQNSIGSVVGFPDLVMLRRDRKIVAELKVGKNKPTQAQTDWLDAFQMAGIESHLWRPEDWPAIERTLT